MDGHVTIKSFADHTIEVPFNARLQAVANAKNRTHATAVTSGNDQKGRLAVLREAYGRDKLPNPTLFNRINLNSIGSQDYELSRMPRLSNKSAGFNETLQEWLYRCALAELKSQMNFPS